MPRENTNTGGDAAPHFDALGESIINDASGTQSSQMGVRMERKVKKNPMNLSEETSKEMANFEQLMRGKVLDKTNPGASNS